MILKAKSPTRVFIGHTAKILIAPIFWLSGCATQIAYQPSEVKVISDVLANLDALDGKEILLDGYVSPTLWEYEHASRGADDFSVQDSSPPLFNHSQLNDRNCIIHLNMPSIPLQSARIPRRYQNPIGQRLLLRGKVNSSKGLFDPLMSDPSAITFYDVRVVKRLPSNCKVVGIRTNSRNAETIPLR